MFQSDADEEYWEKNDDAISNFYIEDIDVIIDTEDKMWKQITLEESTEKLANDFYEHLNKPSNYKKLGDGTYDSNNMNISESSQNLIKDESMKDSAASKLTSSELEFFEQLSTDSIDKIQVEKRFKHIDTDKRRAWEHIHKYSNNIRNDDTFKEILELKKKQNLYKRKEELSIADTASSIWEPEPETASDTMTTKSKNKKSINVSPSLINKRIIRMFFRYYKTNIDWYFRSKNFNISDHGAKMSKALFKELVITFMDTIFENTLDLLDENQVDKILESLSIIYV